MSPETIIKRFRTARDILIPKGSNVVYIGRMKQERTRTALVHIPIGSDMHYEWLMYFDDALERGYIEEIPA